MHAIVLRNPAQIRSKKTAQLYYLYSYRREYSDDYKPPAYFCPNIIYLYEHGYWISVHQPHCKNHQKIPPHVTLLRCTTLHKKIHLYSLVHKIPPRNPAMWFSLHFQHAYIINTQTRNPAIWLLIYFMLVYIISTQTIFFSSLKKTSQISETWKKQVTSR